MGETGGVTLRVMEGRLAVCRLEADAAMPAWAGGAFWSVTRTADEVSLVCAEEAVPEGARCERGWRALQVEGPLDFQLTGVLLGIAEPLAAAGVSIFAMSTYDTDYVLLREESLDRAVKALRAAGHRVERKPD